MDSPLLEASRVRIDQAGVATVDGLSLAATSTAADAGVLVLGAARALFEAASGMRGVTHGTLRVAGRSPLVALRAGEIAGAPLEAPLPPDWTPRAYVTWSARLAGHARGDGQAAAREALARMKLDALADVPLGKAAEHVRRATGIAAALATGARTLLLDDPLAMLPEEIARHLGRVIVEALAGRAWIVFAPRVSLASPIALHASEAIVVAGSAPVAQGAPRELAARDRAYAIDVHGDASALATRLTERGAKVDVRGPEARPHQLLVDLAPGQSTRDLITCAEESSAVIVELRPLARAFA